MTLTTNTARANGVGRMWYPRQRPALCQDEYELSEHPQSNTSCVDPVTDKAGTRLLYVYMSAFHFILKTLMHLNHWSIYSAHSVENKKCRGRETRLLTSSCWIMMLDKKNNKELCVFLSHNKVIAPQCLKPCWRDLLRQFLHLNCIVIPTQEGPHIFCGCVVVL